jgi:hypothetical protein
VTAPHYIGEAKSDMRSIKSGWYAIESDGRLSSGPFPSFEECVTRISPPTKLQRGCTETSSLLTSDVEDGVRRLNRNRPLKD